MGETMSKRVLAIGLVCLLAAAHAAAQSPPAGGAAPDREPGVHFILLIDDSGDMRRGRREPLIAALPDLLFRGMADGKEVSPALPRYRPGRDLISVVYFAILKSDGGGCRPEQRGMSADPDDVLSYEGELNAADDDGLRSGLSESWMKGCRFPGQYSPIATAPVLALPYLQKQLKHDRLFSRTFLISATNKLFNTKISPAIELDTFRRYKVEKTEVANQLAYEVTRLFHFRSSPGWDVEVGGGAGYFMISEVTPLPPPDSALSHQRSIRLDRQAVAADRLRVVPELPRSGDLWVRSQGGEGGYGYTPLSLDLRFRGADGAGPWRVGQRSLPEAVSVELKDCGPPLCSRDEEKVVVPLLDAAGEALQLSPEDPALAPGRLSFDVGLRYSTRLYDHIYVRSSERHVDLVPAEAAALPNFFFLLPGVTLDNRELARQWDGGAPVTQDEARNRILARRRWYLVLALLAFAAFLVYLFRTQYERRFRPRLEWRPAAEVVVDFNRPAASRLLVGALEVVNEGEVPWFGRLFRRKEQPSRAAAFSLSYDFFEESGLVMAADNPIGFVRAREEGGDAEDLALYTEEVVSDGRQVYVFLAADAIRDYASTGPAPDAAGQQFEVGLSVRMRWGADDSAGGSSLLARLRRLWSRRDGGEVPAEVACPLTVKPEDERKPVVTFRPNEGERLYFSKGRNVPVGEFLFSSQSEHSYAKPFKWGGYSVETFRDNRPLTGQPISLGQADVTVAPRESVKVPAYLVCDGESVPNPDPVSHVYEFRLVGDFHADSRPGFYTAPLYRDPTVAEIDLSFLYPEPRREVFWSKAGEPRQRLLLADGKGVEEREVAGATITLDPKVVEFDKGTEMTPDLLTVRVGNTGTSNRGVVSVELSAELLCDDVTRASIRLAPGRSLRDLLGVYLDDEEMKQAVRVAEGQGAQTRDVRFHPGLINKIQNAVVRADKLAARVRLDIRITDDAGQATVRVLYVVIPLTLEQLPDNNWLCIDFGTSAIAAALGTGREGGTALLPLQEIRAPGGISFADYDLNNAERGNPRLLPSWVVCDADIRTDGGAVCRPGFPAYYSKDLSLTPGEPDFVGLPATSTQIEQEPERIIYSLKSWLAKPTRSIRLRKQVTYRENGTQVVSDTLPLKEVVESGLAALAEAYLLVSPAYRADRVIICHPNTFTQRHRELLKDIAISVFAPPERLGIPLPERIQLLSESDAVAFYYCRKQKRDRPRSGDERVLVYDFGAGTLDLSLIKVEWKMKGDGSCDPVRWDIEGQLGVPVAGNHFDELLARIIDEQLSDWRLEGHDSVEYRYPVVRPETFVTRGADDFDLRYHRAVIRLWERIREAKHGWDGKGAFNVVVGSALGGDDIVVRRSVAHELPPAPSADRAGLWADEKYTYLSIPADLIHGNTRVKKFISFVSETVIDELCGTAGIPPEEIDTVIASGRGALWPGLRKRVWDRFPSKTFKPDLTKDRAMKEAVVRGAIARQDMAIEVNDKRWKPRLGVLKNYDENLVMEEDWDKPIDLFGSPTFKLVQVNLKHPRPLEDLRPGSLRRHFYIDLTEEIRREGEWARTNELLVRKSERDDGKLAVYLEDKRGHRRVSVFAQPRAAEVKTAPPWPMGDYILEPEVEHHEENNGNG